MPRYEAAARSTLVTASAGAVLFGFRAGTRPAYVRELHLFSITAPTTSGALGLTRSTAIGTGTITGLLGQPTNANDNAGLGQIVTNWGTAVPTVTAASTLRRWASPASQGNGIVWIWEPPGLYVPANAAVNSELVLTNLQATAPGTFDTTFVWEE